MSKVPAIVKFHLLRVNGDDVQYYNMVMYGRAFRAGLCW